MRVAGWILASFAFCAAPVFSRPSPQAEVDEAVHHLDAKPTTPCAAGLTVWVRAEDLRSTDIAEGDARLVNNLTLLAHDEDLLARCRVQSWTLGLRHRERVALKYPAPDIQLPMEPQYNDTWDDNRYQFEGYGPGDEDFGIETVYDSHAAERLAYDKELEKYARALRNHDHWIVHEKERHNFEALWPMGAVGAPREDLQVVSRVPFAIAVPLVVLPPKVGQGSTYYRGLFNVTYADEVDLTYVAYVTMADGDVIEVSAGETTFLPPALWPLDGHIQQSETRAFQFDAETKVALVYNYELDRNNFEDPTPSETKLANLNLKLKLEIVPTFVQGDAIQLNGTATFNNSAYELDSLRVRLAQHVRPTWAAATLQADKQSSPTLLGELYQIVGVEDRLMPKDFRAQSLWAGDRAGDLVPKSVADHLDSLEGCESVFYGHNGSYSCQWNCEATLSRPSQDSSTITLHTWANISSSAAFTTREAAFEDVQAALLIDITIREKIADDNLEGSVAHTPSHSEQTLQEEKHQWTEDRCNYREYNKETRKGRTYLIQAAIEDVQVLPREVPLKRLNNDLTKRLLEHKRHHTACSQVPVSHLSPLARAPIFIDPTKVNEAVSQLCTPSAFPLLNATVTSRHRRPGAGDSHSDSTLRFVTHRWRYQRILSHEVKDESFGRYIGSGTAGKKVGKLWAEKVLAPMIKAEKQEAGQGLLGGIKQTVFW